MKAGHLPGDGVAVRGQYLGYRVAIRPGDGEPARWFVVRGRGSGKWQVQVLPAGAKREAATFVPAGPVVVSAVSRTGIEGEPVRAK